MTRSSTYWMAARPLVWRRADITGGMIFPLVLLETAPQASGFGIWPPLPSVEEGEEKSLGRDKSQPRLAANQVSA